MIQDIAPHLLQNQFIPDAVPEEDSLVFCFENRSILMKEEGDTVRVPVKADLPEDTLLTFLFRLDDRPCFLAEKVPAGNGCSYLPQAMLRVLPLPRYLAFAGVTAMHLNDFYKNNRYCGTCGTATVPSQTERSLVCEHCGRIIYPRIAPAVIVGVIHGDELLLTRYKSVPGRVRYNALVAGFTEIGETVEETVAREVMEETGLRVKNLRYYKSQPWGFADNLLMGFYCDVDGDPTVTVDHDELQSAIWTKREDIELQPNDFSLTNEMMKRFKEGLDC